MGNTQCTLSFPSIKKDSTSGGNARFVYSTTAMQGWRRGMEDAHAAELYLDEGVENSNAFFAVYDGHGGAAMAKFAGVNVHKRLVTEKAYQEKRYKEALKRAFLGTDEDFLADPAHDNASRSTGCTAIAALVTSDDKIYVANAGDSRSVLSVKGEAESLSFDHTPSNWTEERRIIAAGGYVKRNRVNGDLAPSRALGDFRFKKNESLTPENQIITANPEVTVHDITEEAEFIVVACDGIWDCMSSQQVVDFVRLKISEGHELDEIGKMLCDHCLAPDNDISGEHLDCKGCGRVYCDDCQDLCDSGSIGVGCDNMTVVIVGILNGRTKEEWSAWITDRVKDRHGYMTPRSLPTIYDKHRLQWFKKRREWEENPDRKSAEQGENPFHFLIAADDVGGFAMAGGPSGLRARRLKSSFMALVDRG